MGQASSKKRGEPIDPALLRPHGLYPTHEWDERLLRRLILDRKLAPCHPGSEEEALEKEECPICMLNYPGGLNRSSCCGKAIFSCLLAYLAPRRPAALRRVRRVLAVERSEAIDWSHVAAVNLSLIHI